MCIQCSSRSWLGLKIHPKRNLKDIFFTVRSRKIESLKVKDLKEASQIQQCLRIRQFLASPKALKKKGKKGEREREGKKERKREGRQERR